ncbi:phosphoenolpyruvate carboxykinase (ATP) [Psychroserpens luteus]|uniref:HprK-related kinase B n=1 Tax=Psychroserpens luteus TaxID=1434066 RepID=A0ABW5ZZL3_9FLAO|nr:hypothetical protein [Psychroserpens luteus]
MKTDLSPKYIHKINETIILWFQRSNKYIIVSESIYALINLFLNTDNKVDFKKTLFETTEIGNERCEELYLEISNFLEDANAQPDENHKSHPLQGIPKVNIERTYNFDGKLIRINFQSERIESLIHPQITHHLTHHTTSFDAEFDIFKTLDTLHLFKNKSFVGSYNTQCFHLLQGKFALELTNTIHNTQLDKWIATFHASTVTNNSEAIMIIGDSGNGKSTLSALLMAHGFDLLADDFTPLYEDMNLYRYPSAISIKKGAFNLLESKISDFNSLKTYTNGPKKVNLKYLPQNSDSKNSHFPCNKIVYVKFDKTKKSELIPISVEKILETLIPDSWISPNEAHALSFLNWLKQVKCYELRYSDNDFATNSFNSLFGD